ncbi:MAG: hypothetical protein AB7G93_09755 [Bdellovibrionales bacterium]
MIPAESADSAEADEQQFRLLGRLVYTLTHDLNNLLTVILGESCHLRESCESGRADVTSAARTAAVIESTSERMAEVLVALGTVAARTPGKEAEKVLALADVIHTCHLLIGPRFRAESVRFHWQAPDELLLCGRRGTLCKVFLSLFFRGLDDMRQYPLDQREMWLEPHTLPERLVIRVRFLAGGEVPRRDEWLDWANQLLAKSQGEVTCDTQDGWQLYTLTFPRVV